MFDVFMIINAAWSCIRIGTFLIGVTTILTFIYTSQLKELNSNFLKMIIRIQNMTRLKVQYYLTPIDSALSFLIAQNEQIYKQFAYFNKSFISQTMLVSIGTNFFANIYMIALLTYRSLALSEKQMLISVISMQTLLVSSAAIILNDLSNSLYFSQNAIFKGQLLIGGRAAGRQFEYGVLLLKLKFLKFYEFLNTHNKFHFTMGSMASFTKQSIFQVNICFDIKNIYFNCFFALFFTVYVYVQRLFNVFFCFDTKF